jgi:hypothetical protein
MPEARCQLPKGYALSELFKGLGLKDSGNYLLDSNQKILKVGFDSANCLSRSIGFSALTLSRS